MHQATLRSPESDVTLSSAPPHPPPPSPLLSTNSLGLGEHIIGAKMRVVDMARLIVRMRGHNPITTRLPSTFHPRLKTAMATPRFRAASTTRPTSHADEFSARAATSIEVDGINGDSEDEDDSETAASRVRMKTNFHATSAEELGLVLKHEMGEAKPFRVQQIRDWVYKKGVEDFQAMQNLPLSLRDGLDQRFSFGSLTVAEEQVGMF